MAAPKKRTTAKKSAPRTTAKAKVEETPQVTEQASNFPPVEAPEVKAPRKRRGYFAV